MKRVILYLFIFSSLSTTSFANENLGCIDGKIKYIDGKSEIITKESYCFNSSDKTLSSSIKCADDKECQSENSNPILVKSSALKAKLGSPGFMICKSVEGIPQLIEYWDNKAWIPTARCLFKDKSFLDLGSLSVKVKYVE